MRIFDLTPSEFRAWLKSHRMSKEFLDWLGDRGPRDAMAECPEYWDRVVLASYVDDPEEGMALCEGATNFDRAVVARMAKWVTPELREKLLGGRG